jgi:hypothetical protein
MYVEKPEQLTIWNGGSIRLLQLFYFADGPV